VRFTRGAPLDLVLLSADGRVLQPLTDDRALESLPEWDASAPAGMSRLFFTSDRTGVRELYGLELNGDESPQLYLTARVPTGLNDVTLVPNAGRTTIVATVTHADGRRLERFVVDRAEWVPAPAAVAEFASRSETRSEPAVETTAPEPYSPPRDLLPTGWTPVLGTVAELGAFLGAATGGVDVIGRHQWQGSVAFGADGRTIGSALYVYRRFPRAQLFGVAASTWRLEQRIESEDGELLRLERTRSMGVGLVVPWRTPRQQTLLSARIEIEDRHREDVGSSPAGPVEPIQPEPALVGGRLGLSFGNTQEGLRSISVQDGVTFSVAADYLKATTGDRWRSGWQVASSVYRSFPSWTTSGRPVLAASVRVAEERGPAASRLTAGGIGTTAILDSGGTSFEVRGYPPGFVTANAMWNARTELRLPVARVSRGLGTMPLYLRHLSASWFVDSVGGASRVDRLGAPQLLSTGAELSSDIALFSFVVTRLRAGVGVPLKSLGPVSRGAARFYVTAGASF
jgi:hypothetical protein